MSWTRAFVFSLLSILFLIAFSSVVKSSVVRDDSKPADARGAGRQVFMAESDASNFFKRRSRRSPKYYAELQGAGIACGFIGMWSARDDDVVCFDWELSKFRRTTNAPLAVPSETKAALDCEFCRDSHKRRRSHRESQAEQRMKRAASERRREYNEEQRDEYENYVEEDRDEINERTREMNEQLREYHYDGLYPRFHWFH